MMYPSPDSPGPRRNRVPHSRTVSGSERTPKNNAISLPHIPDTQVHDLSHLRSRRGQDSPFISPLFKQSESMPRRTHTPSLAESNLLLLNLADTSSPPQTPTRDGSKTPLPQSKALPVSNDHGVDDWTKMFSNKIGDFLESLSTSEDDPVSPIPRLKTFAGPEPILSPLTLSPRKSGKKGLLRPVPLPNEDEDDPKDPFICSSPSLQTHD